MAFLVDNVIIQQIFKGKLFDLSTDECVAVLTDLQECTVENTAEQSELYGGGRLIASFSFKKKAKVTMKSATFAMGTLGAQVGALPVVGANSNYVYTDLFTATNETSATLTKTPVASPKYIYIYNANTGTLGKKFSLVTESPDDDTYTVSTKTITFGTGSTLVAGTQLIAFYNVASPATTTTLTNRSDLYSKTYKLVLDGLVRSNSIDYAAQLICYNFKLADNFTFSTSDSGEASVHDLSGDVLSTSGLTPKYWDYIFLDSASLT